MDRRSQPGPEPTTLEAVGNQWHYTLVVVQAREEEEEKGGMKGLVTASINQILTNTNNCNC